MNREKVNIEISRNPRTVNLNYLQLKLTNELYDLIATEADRQKKPMNEVAAALLAKALGAAPRVATVPRKQMGRPRKARVPA